MRKCIRVTVGIVGLALAASLVQAPSAYPSGQAVTDYEISLHELGKAKKGHPAKRKPTDRRKSKNNAAIQQKASPAAINPQGESSRTNPPSSKSNMVAAPAVDAHSALAEKPRISHDPYSYLVAGKQTVILAVISSATDIKSVYCKFRGEEKGADAIAPMTRVDGTQYTYRAILPGLSPNARNLHYRLVVVDTLGSETQSREFSTAVKSTPVIPGWQLEDSPEAPAGAPPASGKPLEKSPDPLPPR